MPSDGESTDEVSEGHLEFSSSGEESDDQALRSRAGWGVLPPAASLAVPAATETNWAELPEGLWDFGSSGDESDDPPWRFRYGPGALPADALPVAPPAAPPAAPATAQTKWVELPEDGLIDLDEAEGRKRGDELLRLLCFPTPKVPVATSIPALAPLWCNGGKGERSARGPLLSSAAPFVPRPPMVQVVQQPTAPSPLHDCSPHAAWYGLALCEAASRAFGADVSSVEGSLRTGFTVQLSEGSVHHAASQRLEELGRQLWPLLGEGVALLEPNLAGGRAWLTMHYVVEAPNSCWDFARTGRCPRGRLCRWPHALAQKRTVDIEVVR